MRRTDRLFQIIQILRRSTGPVTAAAIAQELETSKRSVYRDIQALIGQRAPITGEAGFGYVIDADYDMPPLMLTPDEIDAVVLGAQWVANHADAPLARAARDVMVKVAAAVPENLRGFVETPAVGTRPVAPANAEVVDIALFRQAIRMERKLRLHYRADGGALTERVVWPVMLGYAETSRLLIGWCELRGDFRHFRSERILEATMLDIPIGLRPGELRHRWQRWRNEKAGAAQANPQR